MGKKDTSLNTPFLSCFSFWKHIVLQIQKSTIKSIRMKKWGQKLKTSWNKWTLLHFRWKTTHQREGGRRRTESVRYITGLSKWAHVLMSLGARVLTMEVGTYKYGVGEGKKEPVGMDWDWRYWYELVISIRVCVCVHACAHTRASIYTRMLGMCLCILCVCIGICTWVYGYVPSTQILFSNNILPLKQTRVP